MESTPHLVRVNNVITFTHPKTFEQFTFVSEQNWQKWLEKMATKDEFIYSNYFVLSRLKPFNVARARTKGQIYCK